MLKKINYQGPVTLDETLYAGVTLPSLICIQEMTRSPLLELLMGVETEMKMGYGAGIKVSLAPYPTVIDHPYSKGLKVEEWIEKHVWLVDAADGQVGVVNGDVGWVSSSGGSDTAHFKAPREAKRRALRTANTLSSSLDELQYRTDIGGAGMKALEMVRFD